MKKDTDMKAEQTQASKSGTFGTIFGTILCIILIPILIINVTMIIKGYANPDKYPMFLGYAPLIVKSDSMFPEFQTDDLIIIKAVDPEQLQEGDVITFFDPDSTSRSVVTHRIIQVVYGNELTFITKGDANNSEDTPLPAENVIGRYLTAIPSAGAVANFLGTTAGLVVCVALPMLLLVTYELIRRKKYSKSREADTQALLAELEALRASQAEADAKSAEAGSSATPEP